MRSSALDTGFVAIHIAEHFPCTTNIIPKSQLMYAWDSNTAIATSFNCNNGSPVVPGESCAISPTGTAPILGRSCKVTFSTSAAGVRGSLELTDAYGDELSQVELR